MAQVTRPAGTGFRNGLYIVNADGTYTVVAGADGLAVPGAQSVQTLTGAGAVNLTTAITKLVTTGANALTLANGQNGQEKVIIMVTDGGDGTLIPATRNGFASIVFNDVGDTATLVFTTTTGWSIKSQNGVVVA